MSHDRVTHVTQNEVHYPTDNSLSGGTQKSSDNIQTCDKAPSELKVVCMNIKGVSDKLEICDSVKTLSCCDIIMLSETWLTKDSKKSKFKIDGFVPEN